MSATPRRSRRVASPSQRSRAATASSVRRRLATAIDQMPPRDRHVLNLVLIEGLNELETAQALGVEAPMVHRGFVALMRKLHRVAEYGATQTPAKRTTRTARLRRAS